MQAVIEAGRTIRERHNRPLKQPLRKVTVVHSDKEFLEDITGRGGGVGGWLGGFRVLQQQRNSWMAVYELPGPQPAHSAMYLLLALCILYYSSRAWC